MKPRLPNPTSGHLDRSFFFGVQRSDYNFNFEVSRGPFSISTLRCPEVTATSEVSRGPFREILNGPLDTEGFEKTRRRPRCPEVRLGKS